MKTIGIAFAFAAGTIASRLLLARVPSGFATDLAQPLPVATDWGATGAVFWLVLAATIAVAFVVYALQLRRPLSTGGTLLAGALALVAGWFWLPLFSSDVYAYGAYGEMARIGLNAYAPAGRSSDTLIAAANWQWRPENVPICVYGPAFVAIAHAIAGALRGFGVLAVLDGFRMLACAALLLSGYLAALLGGARAAAFIVCNPVALFAALEGHNDTLALAAVLLGIVIARRAPALGAAAVALAASIKLPALAASLAFALDRILARRNARAVLGGTIVGIAAVVTASRGLIGGVRSGIVSHGHYLPLASIQALGLPVAALVCVFVLVRARSMGTPIDRWCTIALAAWIAIPNPYPWYALWLLPLAAFAHDRRARVTVLAVTSAALLRYLPDAAGLPSPLLSLGYGAIAVTAYVPLVLQ
ncbi:MAG TPA: hypothetical protein VMF11_05475 [Candidatus Baltobacteraceae bacterium]|nr:hypothetical protein [Candidatus Baltobacteraceae bacterium]